VYFLLFLFNKKKKYFTILAIFLQVSGKSSTFAPNLTKTGKNNLKNKRKYSLLSLIFYLQFIIY